MDIRDELAMFTGRPIRISDPVEFVSAPTFEQIGETPMEFVKLGDTTPSVLNIQRLRFQNTSPTTITNFRDGQQGQYIIVVGDGQTTVTHGTNIFNAAGSNITLVNNRVYAYVLEGNIWREQGGAPVPNLNPLSQALGANVVLVSAGVWYNITSLFLNAGTWLLQAHVTFVSNHNADILYGCRISDGASAHYASAQTFAHSKDPNTQTLSLCALVTIGVAATIRVQGITNVSGSVASVVSQTPEYPVGNNATILTAIRVG